MGKHSDGPKRRHNESGWRPGWGILHFSFWVTLLQLLQLPQLHRLQQQFFSVDQTANDLMRVNSEFVSNEIDEIDESELHFEKHLQQMI
jgi:hypothetical protein